MDPYDVRRHALFHVDHERCTRYFRERRVYAVQIESNLACPQGCIYCYASSRDAPVQELPAKTVRAVIDSARAMGVRAIDWLGGDPLVRGGWSELMCHARERGLVNDIWTGGMPLEQMEVARKVVEVTQGGFLSVHLDSIDEAIFGALHTGNARRKMAAILRGVENVQSLGKTGREMINCITFNRLVADDAPRTMRYFQDHFGMRTCLTQICLSGGAEGRQDLVPTLAEVNAACAARDAIHYGGSDVSIRSMDTSKLYCGSKICVTVEGDVTPCSVVRAGFGNVARTPLDEIVRQHKDSLLYAALREHQKPASCAACRSQEVCWGCRASAYHQSGDLCAPDHNCGELSRTGQTPSC